MPSCACALAVIALSASRQASAVQLRARPGLSRSPELRSRGARHTMGPATPQPTQPVPHKQFGRESPLSPADPEAERELGLTVAPSLSSPIAGLPRAVTHEKTVSQRIDFTFSPSVVMTGLALGYSVVRLGVAERARRALRRAVAKRRSRRQLELLLDELGVEPTPDFLDAVRAAAANAKYLRAVARAAEAEAARAVVSAAAVAAPEPPPPPPPPSDMPYAPPPQAQAAEAPSAGGPAPPRELSSMGMSEMREECRALGVANAKLAAIFDRKGMEAALASARSSAADARGGQTE